MLLFFSSLLEKVRKRKAQVYEYTSNNLYKAEKL